MGTGCSLLIRSLFSTSCLRHAAFRHLTEQKPVALAASVQAEARRKALSAAHLIRAAVPRARSVTAFVCGVISERVRRSAALCHLELNQGLQPARLRWGRQQKWSAFAWRLVRVRWILLTIAKSKALS